MNRPYDVIVIGSGFGGAVTACRAAQAGARVLVLERGRRWSPDNYPRAVTDPWLFDAARPEKKNGWLDLRLFSGMAVAQGAGVGGGSLCYSSVVMPADRAAFADGWPAEIDYADLQPCYGRVRAMLAVREIPERQRTPRYELLRSGAEQAGWGERVHIAPLAVTFDEQFHYGLPDPIDKRHTRARVNEQGQWQGSCVHLGNCDIGCDVRAKNTLDLNYLAIAERHGAQIRPLHLVRVIEPDGDGYRVHFDRLEDGVAEPGSERAERVVLSAGSLGTTELLLRCRDEFRTLPRVSGALGKGWSGNGNFLTPAWYDDPERVRQSIGPTISAVLDLMDGAVNGQRIVVEDDGFPNLLLNALRQCGAARWMSPLGWSFPLRRGLDEKNPLARLMVWLGAGVDAGDGQLRLRRRWFAPWSRKLTLDWDVGPSRPVIDAILDVHRRLTEATGGRLRVPLYWRWLRWLVTVHPLGGCRMANTADEGVVNHTGELFGHPRLFVADGSLFPRPIGRNPSMTIAALAERNSQFLF